MPAPPPVGGLRLEAVMEALQRQQAARLAQGVGPLAPPHPPPPPPPPAAPPGPSFPGSHTLEAPEKGLGEVGAEEEEDGQDEEEEEAGAEDEAAKESRPGTRGSSSPSSQPPGPHPHEWTYEEQFKQVGPSQCQALPLPTLWAKQSKGINSTPTPTVLCRMEGQR